MSNQSFYPTRLATRLDRSFGRLRLCSALAAALVLWLSVTIDAHAGHTDSGTSQNLFIRKQLSDDRFLISRSSFATRGGTDDLFFGFADITLGWRLSRQWSLDVGYRHAWLKLASGWRNEYRPLANLAWRDSWGEWKISNRHRLELRFFEGDSAEDRARYRNETRLLLPPKYSLGAWRPSLEEELFYEFNGSGFNLNWLTLSLRYPIAKPVSVKIGYRWQAQKFNDDWHYRNVLVTGLAWRF